MRAALTLLLHVLQCTRPTAARRPRGRPPLPSGSKRPPGWIVLRNPASVRLNSPVGLVSSRAVRAGPEGGAGAVVAMAVAREKRLPTAATVASCKCG